MRRLRVAAQVNTDLGATSTPAGIARRRAYNAVWDTDPMLAGFQLALLMGPDNVPTESFSQQTVNRILALT